MTKYNILILLLNIKCLKKLYFDSKIHWVIHFLVATLWSMELTSYPTKTLVKCWCTIICIQYTVKVLSFIDCQFLWILCFVKTMIYKSNQIQNFHIIILCQLWNYKYRNPRSQEVYLNHENWHPRINVLSQFL